MRFVGVDPGKDGGIVELSQDAKIICKYKPPLIVATKGKTKDEYDLPAICELFRSFGSKSSEQVMIVLEKGQPMALAGSLAQFQRGFAFGMYQAMFVALGLSYHVVPPKTWQKVMFAGVSADDTKAASILVAKRLWPKEDWRRTEKCRTDDDGYTDAALIGDFGRRTLSTLPSPVSAAVRV